MKKPYAVPTTVELRELFEAHAVEHDDKSSECMICAHNAAMQADPAVIEVCALLILQMIDGPHAMTATFAHFFRAGMLWQEKQATIYKDAEELSHIFNLCDERPE